MVRTRRTKRGLAALALGIGMLTLAPVASSIVAFSSGADRHPSDARNTVIHKNGEMPAWIADVVSGQSTETAREDTSIIDSTLI